VSSADQRLSFFGRLLCPQNLRRTRPAIRSEFFFSSTAFLSGYETLALPFQSSFVDPYTPDASEKPLRLPVVGG
jgi:hypothetical protein